jgi:hypothetical protein
VVGGRHTLHGRHTDVARMGKSGSPFSCAALNWETAEVGKEREEENSVRFRYFSYVGES